MTLEVHAALDGPWEILGQLIVTTGHEDSSGFRRMLVEFLQDYDFASFQKAIPTATRGTFDNLREAFVNRFGEPS